MWERTKFKKCCLLKASSANKFLGGSLSIVSDGRMLMNRVDREARIVAESFDSMSREGVMHLEAMYQRIAALMFIGTRPRKQSRMISGRPVEPLPA